MADLCACGCGREVKPGRRFITGHNLKTPEMRAKVATRNKRGISAEMRTKLKARPKPVFTEAYRSKISAALKGRIFTAEHRANIGAKSRGRKHSAETRAKMRASAHRGPDHHGWTGGQGLYPLNWTSIAREIRSRDGGTCLLCGTLDFLPWKGADVHHIDKNKTNLDPRNLASLCRTCHKTAEWHSDEYAPRLRAILTERYGYAYD
jgi:5-methylcytosine-specific restriction endonuclease McrA